MEDLWVHLSVSDPFRGENGCRKFNTLDRLHTTYKNICNMNSFNTEFIACVSVLSLTLWEVNFQNKTYMSLTEADCAPAIEIYEI